jgi:hypothetical protein
MAFVRCPLAGVVHSCFEGVVILGKSLELRKSNHEGSTLGGYLYGNLVVICGTNTAFSFATCHKRAESITSSILFRQTCCFQCSGRFMRSVLIWDFTFDLGASIWDPSMIDCADGSGSPLLYRTSY